MKNEKNVATAANSKTMNAVENVKLFAAAVEVEPVINFRDPEIDLSENDPANDKTSLKKKLKRK